MKHYALLKIYCDGGARGNPGPAAAGVAVLDEHDTVIAEFGHYLGEATNNFAEYKAVILAFEKLKDFRADKVEFYLDSELVVRQLNGQYRVRHATLQPLHAAIQHEIKQFGRPVSFTHVPRALNKLADAQVNHVLDAAQKL